MQKDYVTRVEGAYRIGDTRVSLDSLVYLFREGMSAESMVDSYPALTLEQVHGALAFYLANQNEIDAYLMEGYRAAQSQHQRSRTSNAELIAKLLQRVSSEIISALRPTLLLRACKIRKCCGLPQNLGEFLSARIGGPCLLISLDSLLALGVPGSYFCVRPLPYRPRSTSCCSYGLPVRRRSGLIAWFGFRFSSAKARGAHADLRFLRNLARSCTTLLLRNDT